MRKFCIVLIAASGLYTLAARAQITNLPPTELETFEAQTGTVIVKGAGQVGALAVDVLNIEVISKESLNVSTGRRQYGMAVEVVANNQRVWKKVVDYDEMDSLLNGLNYLARIDYKVTALPTFVAGYVTKSGLRVGAFHQPAARRHPIFHAGLQHQQPENFNHLRPNCPSSRIWWMKPERIWMRCRPSH